MSRRDRSLVTVSPPTFDRTAFADCDRTLAAAHAPFDRDWLMARFAEGLEIRMLREPQAGFVLFQPGRLCWRPIEGAENAVVVHDIRTGMEGDVHAAATRMWDAVEDFARYYGYSSILALTGRCEGLIAPPLAPRRNWVTMDTGPGDTRLVGKVLQGPIALPRLPRDWSARAVSAGPGLVIQTTGESARMEQRADRIERLLQGRGLPVRRDRFADAEAARLCATSPGAVFSVLLDGERLGGAELTDRDILREIRPLLDAD